jgi:hypothetical protein
MPLLIGGGHCMRPGGGKNFFFALLGACAFVAVSSWLASGTMAPYAATLRQPRILKPCNYLLNSDHAHFEAPFLMLDGAPREQWDWSSYLRRTLFPLLAYPLMKAFGFLVGGVIASIIIQVAAVAAFVLYIRRRVGDAGAYAAMALLATYPGIYYWAGLPYCHAMIVPASLGGMMILCELDREGLSLRRAGWLSLAMGVLFLAYDLLPIFAPPVLLILLLRRRFAAAAVALPMLLLPTLLDNAVLYWLYDLPFRNKNTQTYFDIVQGYLNPSDFAKWGSLAAKAPGDFVRTYFFSNFYFLPALFLVLLIANRFTRRPGLTSAEMWLLLTTALLFAFINLAPPTPGWPFRGSGLARIYQPAFAAMLMFAARMAQTSPHRRPIAGALAATCLLNAAVVLGPALRLTLADHVYHAFYRHADAPRLSIHLDAFGRRPLGFCDESIAIEDPPKRLNRAQLQRLAEEGGKLTKAQKQRLRQSAPPKPRRKRLPSTSPTSAPTRSTSPQPDGQAGLQPQVEPRVDLRPDRYAERRRYRIPAQPGVRSISAFIRRSAFPRWLIACFSSGSSSAVVLPSDGKKNSGS